MKRFIGIILTATLLVTLLSAALPVSAAGDYTVSRQTTGATISGTVEYNNMNIFGFLTVEKGADVTTKTVNVRTTGNLTVKSGAVLRVGSLAVQPLAFLTIEPGATVILGSEDSPGYHENHGFVIIEGTLKGSSTNKKQTYTGGVTLHAGGVFDVTFSDRYAAEQYVDILDGYKTECIENRVIAEFDHQFVDGACSVCGKEGTPGETLYISNLQEMNAFIDRVGSGEHFESRTVVLTADIGSMNEVITRPVGADAFSGDARPPKYFSGTFDGCGHTVYIGRYSLFAYTLGATIKNVTVNSNTTVSDGFYSNHCFGSIVGIAEKSDIINCVNLKNLDGDITTGGIVGESRNSRIIGCINYGNLYNPGDAQWLDTEIGGILGRTATFGPQDIAHSLSSTDRSEIISCINYGDVTGAELVGGIAGKTRNISISNCASYGKLTLMTRGYLGGIVGYCTDNFNGANLCSFCELENSSAFSDNLYFYIGSVAGSANGIFDNVFYNGNYEMIGRGSAEKEIKAAKITSAQEVADALNEKIGDHEYRYRWKVGENGKLCFAKAGNTDNSSVPFSPEDHTPGNEWVMIAAAVLIPVLGGVIAFVVVKKKNKK